VISWYHIFARAIPDLSIKTLEALSVKDLQRLSEGSTSGLMSATSVHAAIKRLPSSFTVSSPTTCSFCETKKSSGSSVSSNGDQLSARPGRSLCVLCNESATGSGRLRWTLRLERFGPDVSFLIGCVKTKEMQRYDKPKSAKWALTTSQDLARSTGAERESSNMQIADEIRVEADLDVRPMRLKIWRRRKEEEELLLDKEVAHHNDDMHLCLYARNEGSSAICITLVNDDDPTIAEVDRRTETTVASDPIHPADPLTLWITVRCLRTGLVCTETQERMCQRLAEMWLQTPSAFHPALIDALSHIDAAVLGKIASSGAFGELLLSTVKAQLEHEAIKLKSRVFFSQYLQNLLRLANRLPWDIDEWAKSGDIKLLAGFAFEAELASVAELPLETEAEPEPEPELEPEPEPELHDAGTRPPQPELEAEPAPETEPQAEPEPQIVEEAEPPLSLEPVAARVDPPEVRQLEEMGFSRNGALRALAATGGQGIEIALEWCFAHSDDPSFNNPFESPEDPAVPETSVAEAGEHGGAAPAVLAVSGCPVTDFNATFNFAGEHQSIARFETAESGQHLFFDRMQKRWRLSRDFRPERTNCLAWCGKFQEGILPLGKNEWRVYFDGEWRDREVTLTVVQTGTATGLPPARRELVTNLNALTELLTQSGSSLLEQSWWDSHYPSWKRRAAEITLADFDGRFEKSASDVFPREDPEAVVICKQGRWVREGESGARSSTIEYDDQTGHFVTNGWLADTGKMPELIMWTKRGNESGRRDGERLVWTRLDSPPVAAEEPDVNLAFDAAWTVELDSALVEYASERARVLGKSAPSTLKLSELFEVAEQEDTAAVVAGETTPDKRALSRNVSSAPQYSGRSPSRCTTVTSLREMPQSTVRMRFVLLQAFNNLVKPCLRMIDFSQFAVENALGHKLCCVKGRLFPDIKEGLIAKGLEMTRDRSGSVPKPSLHIPAPGSEPTLANTVFEQLFKQLHKQHSLRMNGRKNQLWEVRMSGEGARVLFTDTIDQGGWFRTSIRSLCSDLQSPPVKKADGEMSTPLFLQTPNFVNGSGSGEDMTERYVPNPACVTGAELERFTFIGALMGAAARFNGFMELDLPALVWRKLLGEQIGAREIHAIDADIASHLEAVLSVDDEVEWNAQAEIDPVCWSVRLVDGSVSALRANGEQRVGFSERTEYVATVERVWLEQFKPQIDAICAGFNSSFPVAVARLQTWRELQRSVCGVSDVSVDALQRIAKYEGSYSEDSDYMKMFWKCVREMTGTQRRQLLGFCWGRSRLPASPTEPFTIDSQGGADDRKLPQSHTCCEFDFVYLHCYDSLFLIAFGEMCLRVRAGAGLCLFAQLFSCTCRATRLRRFSRSASSPPLKTVAHAQMYPMGKQCVPWSLD
jgi:outer membrane biosynthesis protein TonB